MSSIVPNTEQSSIDDYTAIDPTFPQFPKLPLELRRMVWHEAIPGSRVIKIEKDPNERTVDGEIEWARVCGAASPPAMLHTSQESREIALKYYTYSFQGRIRKAVYFDFARDYLYFVDGHALCAFEGDELTRNFDPEETQKKVRRIIVGVLNPAGFDFTTIPSLIQPLGRYVNLEVMVFEEEELSPPVTPSGFLQLIWDADSILYGLSLVIPYWGDKNKTARCYIMTNGVAQEMIEDEQIDLVDYEDPDSNIPDDSSDGNLSEDSLSAE